MLPRSTEVKAGETDVLTCFLSVLCYYMFYEHAKLLGSRGFVSLYRRYVSVRP